MNQRLPKSLRIRQSAQIRQILMKGHKYTGNHIILYCLASSNLPATTQAGFLSPKRIGKACDRNRVRRRLREAFRKHRSAMNGSHQILIMGRTSAINAGFQALLDDFVQLCRKARLLATE